MQTPQQMLPITLNCKPGPKVEARWRELHEERLLVAVTEAPKGHLMELWSAADGKKWTLFFRRPDGTLCLAAYGDTGYEYVPHGQDS
jgi:hypothetical protein